MKEEMRNMQLDNGNVQSQVYSSSTIIKNGKQVSVSQNQVIDKNG
jgi:hypothetical protein